MADIIDWDMIMGYDFMVANAIGALAHRATLVREDDECLTWLSTDYACGLKKVPTRTGPCCAPSACHPC